MMMFDLLITALLSVQLLLIAGIDARKMIIPDVLNLLLAVTGALIVAFQQPSWLGLRMFEAIVVMCALWGIARLYAQTRGQTGLGMGDVKFLGAVTLWVGLAGIPWLVLFASLTGLGAVLLQHAFAGSAVTRTTRLPFGPHLAAATLLTWVLQLSPAAVPGALP